VKENRFRYVEQKGFQTFFKNWKEKILNKGTLLEDGPNDDDVSNDEDSNYSHLWNEQKLFSNVLRLF